MVIMVEMVDMADTAEMILNHLIMQIKKILITEDI